MKSEFPARIVTVDRGFIFVGQIERVPDGIVIHNARNIRVWGTTEGLGQLRTGKQPKTVIDACGTIHVPTHAIIFEMEVTGW